MPETTAQKTGSGEEQDLRLYKKAAEVAYQYAKNKAAENKADDPDSNKEEDQ